MSHLFISAAHKSSGKTTVTLGLARALRNRGLKVQPFKKGPDYIDPIWHAQASGYPCYNLDFHMMAESEITGLFGRHAAVADIALVEGNKGLYDGMDVEGSNSNAALAKLLGAPVVLVLDTIGTTRGVAPLLLGYQAFDPNVRIAGVILNKVGGPRHEEKLRAVIGRYTDIPVVGAIHKHEELAIVERHIGLIPGNEAEAADARIEGIARIVAREVDLDALLRIADSAPALPQHAAHAPEGGLESPLRIGISQDRAFGFYYFEDLETLAALGAELVPLDTLADSSLPEVDALILGGGFPEVFMDGLSDNTSLRSAIREAIEAGLPVYAECGGLMYLSRSIRWDERSAEMVGLIPGDAVMGRRPVGRGYAALEATGHGPLKEPAGRSVPAHEFHYSALHNLPEGLDYAYRVQRGHGIDGRHDGYLYKNLLASYCHRRGTGESGWIFPFLERARAHARQRNADRKAA